MGTRRVARIGGGLVAGAALVLACSSTVEDAEQEPVLVDPTAASQEPAASPPSEDPKDAKYPLPTLGKWQGHYDGRSGSISFKPMDDAARNSPIQPQGFGAMDDSNFEFTTLDAIVVNSGGAPNPRNDAAQCNANRLANPTKYFTGGVRNLNGAQCTNKHLCTTVNIKNASSRTIDKVYVETSDFYSLGGTGTAGFKGDNSVGAFSLFNTGGYPPNHGLDPSEGLWSYGSLAPGATSGTVRWDIYLPSCEDFNWTTTVKGVVRATDYTETGPTPMAANEFIDACSGGATVHATGAAASAVSGAVAIPFPFSFYGQQFGSSNVFGGICTDWGWLGELICNYFGSTDGIKIGVNGVIGLVPGTVTSNSALPSSAVEYTMMPFWDSVSAYNDSDNSRDGKVCYKTTGSAPNRKFTATWKDVTLSGNQARLTFSAVLEESTDAIDFQYLRWSSARATCATNTNSRGGSATRGLQGPDSAAGVHPGSTVNSAFLDSASGCSTNGIKYRYTPNTSL